MEWFVWGILLICQNAAFTWVSRARNSGSVGYHAIASVSSNGIWILSTWIVIAKVTAATDWTDRVFVALFYTACTVTGSVLMHWASMRYLETGKRKVGA